MERSDKRLRVVVIGCGSRGTGYAELAAGQPRKYQLVAASDPVAGRVDRIRELSDHPGFEGYASGTELLEAAPAADVAMICTQDDNHYDLAIAAMERGYDLMLEKPISNVPEEVEGIERRAMELGRRVVVCMVLRYSAFYRKVKQLIDDGVLGEIISINASEGVGPWHFSHSFVRGHWAETEKTSPMILAKCCHDMDLLHWLVGRECRSLASSGSLSHFHEGNAPDGAPERCHQGCPVGDTCAYNANRYLEKMGRRWLEMVYDRAGTASDEEILKWLETAPWGRCAYRCSNSAVDHQVLALEFDGNISGTFTMTAFDSGRHIEIFGTRMRLRGGEFVREISGADIIVTNHSDGRIERISFDDQGGHLGGDDGLINDLYEQIVEWPLDKMQAAFRQVVHGHKIAFMAEEARRSGRVERLDQ